MRIRFLLLSLLIAGTFTFSHACRAAGNTPPAAIFMQKLGDAAVLYLTSAKIPEPERLERLRALFREGFDIQTIGRFVLGKHWREASESQRREFLSLFEDMIVQTYQDRLTDDPVKSFKIVDAMPAEKDSQDSLVSSLIVGTSDPQPTKVTWRVRVEEGQMKIVDVVVNGISESITQRSDFDSVIMKGGGNVEALLDTLRQFKRASQED
jgi:phospholipid transport system substrate-binding protein